MDLRAVDVLGEEARLAALARLGLLDTGAEARFDRLVELAAAVCGTPVALVTLVDRDRQWFKARVGLDVAETDRAYAFCDHVIRAGTGEVFVVADATQDARFADNPLVTGPVGVRFYAGRVVRDRVGFAVGTLCVIDRCARVLDDTQRRMLEHLGGLVEAELARGTTADLLVELDRLNRTKTAIVNNLMEGLVVQDLGGVIVDWNPAAEALLGLTGDELAGRTSIDERWRVVHEDGSPWPGETHPSMTALATGEPVLGAVMGVDRRDGTRVWLRVNAQPLFDSVHLLVGVVATFADITREHDAHVLLDTVWDTAPVGLVVLDADRRIVRCNATYRAQAGRTASELRGHDAADFLHPGDQRRVRNRRRPVVAGDRDPAFDARVVRPDGSVITVAVTTAHVEAPDRLVIAGITDVTEQHRLTRELLRYRYLFEHANDVIAVLDADRAVRFATPSLVHTLGVHTTGIDLTNTIRDRTHPEDRMIISQGLQAACRYPHAPPSRFTARIRDRHDEWRHFEFTAVNLFHEPAIEGIVLTVHDVTDRVHLADQLEHQATHDHLTGLATRALFERELDRALTRAQRDGQHFAVCYLDLDGFKSVNDHHGHATGDAVLTAIAQRLTATIRACDLAVRLGGDEFAVLLEPVNDLTDTLIIVERLRAALIDTHPAVGVSIGVTINHPDDTVTTIIERADHAQYQAKASPSTPIVTAC